MKKAMLCALISLSFNAVAADLDWLDLEGVGEGSSFRFDRTLVVPAGSSHVDAAVVTSNGIGQYYVNNQQMRDSGSYFTGCSVYMHETSSKLRKISSGTELKISKIERDTDGKHYIIRVDSDKIDNIDCVKGFSNLDDDSGKPVPASDLLKENDSSIRDYGNITLGEFNSAMNGIFNITVAAPEDLSVNDAPRGSEEVDDAHHQDSASAGAAGNP